MSYYNLYTFPEINKVISYNNLLSKENDKNKITLIITLNYTIPDHNPKMVRAQIKKEG